MKKVFIAAAAIIVLNFSALSQIDINNKIMLAQSYEQAGDYEKAAVLFEEIYTLQPNNYQVFESLVRVYIQFKKYESAVALIQSKIKSNPLDINLYGMIGSTYYLMGDENKAYEIWEQGIKTQPDNQMSYRVIANFAIQRRAFDKAIEYLNRGKAVSQNPELFSYDLANIYSLTMQYKEAAEEFCILLEKQPSQLSAIENRILTYSNKPSALSQTIEVIEKWKRKDNPSFDYLLARLYVEAKSFDKAYSLYLKIDEKQNNKGAELYNFAQLVFNEGEYELTAKVYEDIVKKYPQSQFSAGSKLGYAKTLEAILEKEYAARYPSWKPLSQPISIDSIKVINVIKSYEDLTSIYPNSEIAFESYFRIGKLYFTRLNNLIRAKGYFEKILSNASMSRFAVESSEQLGRIYLIEGNLGSAREKLEWIASNGRASEENRNFANYNLARLDFYEGNFETAKSQLSKVIAQLKDNIANDAIELSLLLNTASGDSSDLAKFGKAEFFCDQRKFKEAAELYSNIADDPNAFILHHICKINQAEAELAMDNFDKSIELLIKITDEAEKNIYADKALYLTARIYEFGKNNIPKAIECFESLLAKFPNSLYLDDAREAIKELKNKLS